MDTNRIEYDNNIYIETKLLHFLYIYCRVCYLFIYFNNIDNYENQREKKKRKKKRKK